MTVYRYAVPAEVCFDVTAETPEQAAELAKARLLEWIDGLDVETGIDDDCRVYPSDNAEPGLVDERDESEMLH